MNIAVIFENGLKNPVEAGNLIKINITYRYRYFRAPFRYIDLRKKS